MPKLHRVLALAFAVSVPIAPLQAQPTGSAAPRPTQSTGSSPPRCFPDDSLTVIGLTNADGAQPAEIAAGVARIYFSTLSGPSGRKP